MSKLQASYWGEELSIFFLVSFIYFNTLKDKNEEFAPEKIKELKYVLSKKLLKR